MDKATRKELSQKNRAIIRKQKTRRVVMVLILSSILLYITGIYGASLAYFGDFLSNISVYFKVGEGWPTTGEFSKVYQTDTTDNALCLLSDEILTVYSPTADKIFEYNHAMQNPIMDASGSRIVLYNPKQTSFKVLHNSEVIFTTDIDQKIIHVAIAENNTVAVTSESESYKGQVEVYNYAMEKQFVWNCSKGYPVYSSVSDSGEYILTAVLNSENGNIVNDIYVINADEYREEFSIKSSSYPLNIDITNTNKAIITYTNYISVWDLKEQKELYTFNASNKDILLQDYKDSYIMAVLGSFEVEGNAEVYLLDSNLESVLQFNFEEQVIDVAYINQRLYVLSVDWLYEYNMQGELLNKTQATSSQKYLIDYNGGLILSSDNIKEIERTS